MTTEEEEFEFRARLEREQAAAGGAPAKKEAGALDRTQAAVSGVDKGMAKLVGLPVDAVESIINLGIAAYGTAKMAAGGGPGPELLKGSKGGSEYNEKLLNEAGVRTDNPAPDDLAARMLHKGGEIAGSSIIPGGATKEAMAASAKAAMAAAAGGATASETLGDEWTAVGALTPAAIKKSAGDLKTKISATVKPNVEQFEKAGTTPSVGQATQSTFVQGLENLASTFPGGVGVMRKFAERQQKDLGATASTGGSAENAGRAVKTGIDRFVEDFKGRSGQLYDKLDTHVPKDAPVDVTQTRAALAELNADIPSAPALSKWFKSEKMQGIEGSLGKDTAAKQAQPIISTILDSAGKGIVKGETAAQPGGVIPYEAVKKLRTLVGREIAEPSLVSDVPRSKWKALYGALSKDMEAMAAAQGPEAAQAFARANTHYAAGIKRIDEVLEPLRAKVDPEDVFKAFAPNSPDQVNKVRGVMKSLNESERKVVTDAVVNRLGRATPGKQDDMGSVFSSESFLTNYSKLSPGARAQLFPEASMRESMEALAKSASNIREGSKVFVNPSGSAGKSAAYATGGAAVATSVATGSALPIVGAASLVAGANIGARMLTSPKVVHWLAEASNAKPVNMPAHLARLATIYSDTKDDTLKDELGQYIASVSPKTPTTR